MELTNKYISYVKMTFELKFFLLYFSSVQILIFFMPLD